MHQKLTERCRCRGQFPSKMQGKVQESGLKLTKAEMMGPRWHLLWPVTASIYPRIGKVSAGETK